MGSRRFRGRSYLCQKADSAMSDKAEEFDCVECGRHIVRIIARPTEPKLCAECLMFPGWYKNPELRVLLDPEFAGAP